MGTDGGAMKPGVDSEVTTSSRRLSLAIDDESVLGQQVHPDDGQLHVSYYETPRKVAAQT
jgi:hypothetical protein